MTEKARGGNELAEQQNEVTNREEDPAYKESEKKEKGKAQGTEAVIVVKSKIREKNAAQGQSEEEENSAHLKTSKIMTTQSTQSKIYKLGKYKRNKSKPNELNENQELDTKLENADSEFLQTDSKVTLDTNSAPSKKSLMQTKLIAKDSKKLLETNVDEKTESISSKTNLADESQSAFVISHEVESQKEQNIVSPVSEVQAEQSSPRKSASQRQITERGNYMSNVSPLPIEEYPMEAKREEKDK